MLRCNNHYKTPSYCLRASIAPYLNTKYRTKSLAAYFLLVP